MHIITPVRVIGVRFTQKDMSILIELNILNLKRFAKTDDCLRQSCIPKDRRYNKEIIPAIFFIKRVL